MSRFSVALIAIAILPAHLLADDPDAAKRIADLEKQVAASKVFDFELHNALRHEYHYAGQADKEIEQCDIIFQHLPMDAYTLDCLGARESNVEDAVRSLNAVADKYPKRIYVATACRLKAAILTEDKAARAALLYPLLDLQDPRLKAYLKEAKVRYADVVPATRRPPEVLRLRVLLAIDTDSDLKDLLEYELRNFLEFFDELKKGRDEKFTIDVIKGGDLTPDALLRYYDRLDIVPGDGVFFFYTGHGGWDTAAVERDGMRLEKGHFLAMKHGNLLRYQLVDQILAKKPVAAYVLSNACSNTARFNVLERRRPAEWLAFRDLFFQHAGLFNIQAATREEFARGAFFADALLRSLCEPRSAIRRDRKEGPVGWVEFHEKLVEETHKEFRRAQEYVRKQPVPADPKARKEREDFLNEKPHTPQALDLGFWPWLRGGGLPAGLWPQLGHPAGHRMIPNCVALAPDGAWSMVYGHGGFAGGGGVPDAHVAKLKELAARKVYAKHVALGAKGRWGIVTTENDIVGDDLPDSLEQALAILKKNKATIDSLAFGPKDSWVVLFNGHGALSDGIPMELEKVLNGLTRQKTNIQDVAFSPSGGWVVLHGANQFTSDQAPKALEGDLRTLSKLGYRFHTVSIGPDDGWVVVYRPK